MSYYTLQTLSKGRYCLFMFIILHVQASRSYVIGVGVHCMYTHSSILTTPTYKCFYGIKR